MKKALIVLSGLALTSAGLLLSECTGQELVDAQAVVHEASPADRDEQRRSIVMDFLFIQRVDKSRVDERNDSEAIVKQQEEAAAELSRTISELVPRSSPSDSRESVAEHPTLANWLASSKPGRLTFQRIRLGSVDRQAAVHQFGSLIPVVIGAQATRQGVVNNTTMQESGTFVQLTPVVMSDGTLIVDMNLSETTMGDPDEGVVISETNDGRQVRHPRIDTLSIQARVHIRDQQPTLVYDRVETTRSGTKQIAIILVAKVQGNAETQTDSAF